MDEGPDLAALVSLFCSNADLVVVEGFRSAGLDSVLVQRCGMVDRDWVPPAEGTVVATVGPDDTDQVVALLIERYLAKR